MRSRMLLCGNSVPERSPLYVILMALMHQLFPHRISVFLLCPGPLVFREPICRYVSDVSCRVNSWTVGILWEFLVSMGKYRGG